MLLTKAIDRLSDDLKKQINFDSEISNNAHLIEAEIKLKFKHESLSSSLPAVLTKEINLSLFYPENLGQLTKQQ